MDCSLREASRKEQSIAQKNAFFGPIGTAKRAKIPYIRVLLVFEKRLDFLQAKEWFFPCFLRPCISGTFCRFIPCNLSRLRLCERRWRGRGGLQKGGVGQAARVEDMGEATLKRLTVAGTFICICICILWKLEAANMCSKVWPECESTTFWIFVWRAGPPGGGGAELDPVPLRTSPQGGGAATRRNMRREERLTVQGPVKEQQPDGMSHRGASGGVGGLTNEPTTNVDGHRQARQSQGSGFETARQAIKTGRVMWLSAFRKKIDTQKHTPTHTPKPTPTHQTCQ